VKVRFSNVWARVIDANALEVAWLDEYTSCEYRAWTTSPNWSPDRRYHMFERATGLFPAGFVKLVRSAARRDGVELGLEDQRACPAKPELDESLIGWLYDYQKAAVWDACHKGGRGLIKVPTGGGKTELFIALTRVLPCEWLFVVHRTDLVGQAARRFALRTGERVGTWEKGRWQRGTSNVTVSTFQALHHARRKRNPRLKEFFDAVEAVNVDEVHAQPADSFYGVALDLRNAYYRIGMSGTPLDRSDKENLRTIGAMGPLLYEVPYQLLVDRGVLSQSRVTMVRYKHPPVRNGATWREVYRDLIVHNRERNEVLADVALEAAKPCLMFVEELKHGSNLQELMEARGLKVDFAHGDHWLSARQRKIQELVDGQTDVLLTTVIFQEGIDIPSLQSVVVATGKSSVVAALQRIGRGMRATTSKSTFDVWDILDRGHRWLTTHATGRKEAYEAAGHDPQEKTSGETQKPPKTEGAGREYEGSSTGDQPRTGELRLR
jgi:superfamily II DNA or RNA helicase